MSIGNFYHETVNGRYKAKQLDVEDLGFGEGLSFSSGSGAPASTLEASTGSLYIDTQNGALYINKGDAEDPDWQEVGGA